MGIRLEDIIGNEKMKTQIKVASKAAELRNKALPHMLFTGAAGCGKTTTAKAIAHIRDCKFIEATPEMLKTPENAAKLLEKLPFDGYDELGNVIGRIRPAILFVDEAHNLPRKAQEILGLVMENSTHTYTTKIRKQKQVVTRWVPQFTAVCATTDEGKLVKMFRDRFKITHNFRPYNLDNTIKVVYLHAGRMGFGIEEEAAVDIAKRSRGTPRIVVRNLERAIDCAQVEGKEVIDIDTTRQMFEMASIDPTGLTKEDLDILVLLHNNQSSAIGLDNISITLGVAAKTVVSVNEPFLMQRGLMMRGGKGRAITEAGIKYLEDNGHVEKSEEGALPFGVISVRKE